MNTKTQLHTLYVKHDSQFKTLSKIALSEIILKIIYFSKEGVSMKHIVAELAKVILGADLQKDIEAAIELLKRAKKIHTKALKYYLHPTCKQELQKSETERKELEEYILDTYFGKSESNKEDIRKWFNEVTIKFFENFSFEWFFQKTQKGKNSSNSVPNVGTILDETLLVAQGIIQNDKPWLKQQYQKFIDSDGIKENLLFWQFGISMFSSRLITARTYADQLSVEMFKNSKFILDTNILMILDLEEHDLNNSLQALEDVLVSLNIQPVYFPITRDEYLRAMSFRKEETESVFDNYDIDVLKASECPFIKTALKRGCCNKEDVERMFDRLLDIPENFHNALKIERYEYAELEESIALGKGDENLKSSINELYKKRAKRDKREKPLLHDAGLIAGIKFLRKTEKCWVITSDSTLKLFAIQNTVREENELAVGLDILLGILAVNSGGVQVEASNFAPLFKNLIKYSLVPVSETFEVRDLAFILSSNTKVNELPNERVIEVAKEVKRMRISGEHDEDVALFLRRVVEGDKLGLTKDIAEAKSREQFANAQKDNAEKEREVFIKDFRVRRTGELRDAYDKSLRANRLLFLLLPLLLGILIFITIKYFLSNDDKTIQYLIGASVELIFGVIPLIPINRKLVKKYSEYILGIDQLVDEEVINLRKQAKD